MKKLIIPIFTIVCLLAVGCSSYEEEAVVEFDSNPSTGYIWSYNIKDEGLIEVERSYESDCGNDSQTDECGGKDIYTIKGKKEGEDTITFEYIKGEPQKKDKRVSYKVKVDKDLKIKMIKK